MLSFAQKSAPTDEKSAPITRDAHHCSSAASFFTFCKLQDATCFRERLSGECVGRDIGTTQVIFNHAVVRNLSPCKRKFLITLSSQGFARFHH